MDLLKQALSRRTFFRGLITAAVAGTILKIEPTLAMTGQPVLAENKYVTTVRKAKLVVSSHENVLAVTKAEMGKEARHLAAEVVDANTADLITYMLDNFQYVDNPDTRRDMKRLFRGDLKVDALNEGDLALLAEPVVVVAVLRQLLVNHRVSFNPGSPVLTDPWGRFAEQYQSMILDC